MGTGWLRRMHLVGSAPVSSGRWFLLVVLMVQRRVSDRRHNLQFLAVMIDYAWEGMLRHLARPHVSFLTSSSWIFSLDAVLSRIS